MTGPALEALQAYIDETRPELASRLAPLGMDEARQVLVVETGVQVRNTEEIEESCARFLDAFKRIDTTYPTILAFLGDPNAIERPTVPPGGSCGPKDDAHMTHLAMIVRRQKSREAQVDILWRQAALLAQIAPGDPCIARMLQWHGELVGTR